jgi:hypothetical protein
VHNAACDVRVLNAFYSMNCRTGGNALLNLGTPKFIGKEENTVATKRDPPRALPAPAAPLLETLNLSGRLQTPELTGRKQLEYQPELSGHSGGSGGLVVQGRGGSAKGARGAHKVSPNRVAYVLSKPSPEAAGAAAGPGGATASDVRRGYVLESDDHSQHSLGNYSAITDDANMSALSVNLPPSPLPTHAPYSKAFTKGAYGTFCHMLSGGCLATDECC